MPLAFNLSQDQTLQFDLLISMLKVMTVNDYIIKWSNRFSCANHQIAHTYRLLIFKEQCCYGTTKTITHSYGCQSLSTHEVNNFFRARPGQSCRIQISPIKNVLIPLPVNNFMSLELFIPTIPNINSYLLL